MGQGGGADLRVQEVLFYSAGLVAVMGSAGDEAPRLVHLRWPQGVAGHTPSATWLAALPLLPGGAEHATCFALMPPSKGDASTALAMRSLQARSEGVAGWTSHGAWSALACA